MTSRRDSLNVYREHEPDEVCTLHGSLSYCVAERPQDGSRGLQPTVGRGGNPRRGATLGRWQKPTRHASLRDACLIRALPWAEAHVYPRLSLRDKTEETPRNPCMVQGVVVQARVSALRGRRLTGRGRA